MGLLDVRFALPVYIITMLVFFSSFFFLPEKKVSNPQRILSLAVLFMFLTMLHCVLYITWTPAGTYKISGFQGRYLISILPFIFLIFAQNKDYVSEKFQKYYKIFLIIPASFICFVDTSKNLPHALGYSSFVLMPEKIPLERERDF